MKLEQHYYKIWGECPTTKQDTILWIERAGRVCYRSEDKIVEGSGEKFVNSIIKRGHTSVLEASNIVAKYPSKEFDIVSGLYGTCKYLTIDVSNKDIYVGGNVRAWMEHLNISTIDEVYEHLKDVLVTNRKEVPRNLKRITVLFSTDRAVSHELVRHRVASFLQESQRYCAYRMDVTFKVPYHYSKQEYLQNQLTQVNIEAWRQGLEKIENLYKTFLTNGERPEQARSILPNCTATNIVVTASIPDWYRLFNLRCSNAAYPDIKALTCKLQNEFIANEWY